MKSKLALGAVVAAVAVFSQTAFAQASSPTREERKAETAAANKAGKLTPAGEGSPTTGTPSKASDKTREQRKAQTQADAKSGKLATTGEGGEAKKDKADAAKPSQTTREARKAQTEADRKAGKLAPAGDAAAMK